MARDRHAVGELVVDGDKVRFTYLSNTPSFNAACKQGFDGYPGLPISETDEYADALSIFMRRLPNPGRSDYNAYFENFGLSPEANWTPLSRLAYTSARSVSDSFSITETFDGFEEPFEFIFDVAGFRHYIDAASTIHRQDTVQLQPEPNNPYDPDAIQVLTETNLLLGYINRLQAKKLLGWITTGSIQTEIYRLNGRPLYPRLFIFARITPNMVTQVA
jgi:HIRAN domain